MSNIFIKILSLFWLLVIYSLPTTAQLKYRAKEDFGLKGEVKSFIETNTLLFENGDSTKTIMAYYFSKSGRLDSVKANRINGLLTFEKTYRYFNNKIIENNTLELCANTVYFLDSTGNIFFQITVPLEYNIDNIHQLNLIKETNEQYSYYTYNSEKLLNNSIRFSPKKDTLAITNNTYNKKMLLIKQVSVNKESDANSYSEYEYDSLNRIICKALFLDDKIENKTSYIYDKGFTIEFYELFHFEYSNSLNAVINSYDKYENKIEEKTIREDLTTHSLITYQIEYYP